MAPSNPISPTAHTSIVAQHPTAAMLYLHVPFCHRKCLYCAFYSLPATDEVREAYVQALIAELQLRCGEQQHPVRTLYFGGGTPSMLTLIQLARVVEALHRHFDLSQLEEMTFEANPEDLTIAYLDGLRQLGFNRLSLGVQRASNEALRRLNRRHTVRQALEAVEAAHAAGFCNLSVDFIYGLPTPIDFLDWPLDGITHVSAYALTLEPHTALEKLVAQRRMVMASDEEVAKQYYVVQQWLEAHGLKQYEVSNFAREGYHSRHNSGYWNRTPYLGLGPSAHSFDGRRRRWNLSSLEGYITPLTAGSPIDCPHDEEWLTEADAFNELLMTSLRTTRGLSLVEVPEAYRERLLREVQPFVASGWLRTEADTLRPTAEGLLHADGMAAHLFVV